MSGIKAYRKGAGSGATFFRHSFRPLEEKKAIYSVLLTPTYKHDSGSDIAGSHVISRPMHHYQEGRKECLARNGKKETKSDRFSFRVVGRQEGKYVIAYCIPSPPGPCTLSIYSLLHLTCRWTTITHSFREKVSRTRTQYFPHNISWAKVQLMTK